MVREEGGETWGREGNKRRGEERERERERARERVFFCGRSVCVPLVTEATVTWHRSRRQSQDRFRVRTHTCLIGEKTISLLQDPLSYRPWVYVCVCVCVFEMLNALNAHFSECVRVCLCMHRYVQASCCVCVCTYKYNVALIFLV